MPQLSAAKSSTSMAVTAVSTSGVVVTRDQFLFRSPWAVQRESALTVQLAVTEEVAPAMFTSPPGLPPLPDKVEAAAQAKRRASKEVEKGNTSEADKPAVPPVPAGYQVLLKNFPEALANEDSISVILEQAGLDHGLTGITTRKGGKVLLAYTDFCCVAPCVHHFHGKQWGLATGSEPIVAMFVRTVSNKAKQNAVVVKESLPAWLCVDVPDFVPAAVQAKVQSAPAADSCGNGKHNRPRMCSNASTDAGRWSRSASEDCDSLTDVSDQDPVILFGTCEQ